MNGLRFVIAAVGSWFFVGGVIAVSEKRANYWRPIMERIARDSGNGPIRSLRVIPFKGCGWSFGETVYGEFSIGGVPADFLMCRSRHGVRFDLTTYESRWIRGPASAAGSRRAETNGDSARGGASQSGDAEGSATP